MKICFHLSRIIFAVGTLAVMSTMTACGGGDGDADVGGTTPGMTSMDPKGETLAHYVLLNGHNYLEVEAHRLGQDICIKKQRIENPGFPDVDFPEESEWKWKDKREEYYVNNGRITYTTLQPGVVDEDSCEVRFDLDKTLSVTVQDGSGSKCRIKIPDDIGRTKKCQGLHDAGYRNYAEISQNPFEVDLSGFGGPVDHVFELVGFDQEGNCWIVDDVVSKMRFCVWPRDDGLGSYLFRGSDQAGILVEEIWGIPDNRSMKEDGNVIAHYKKAKIETDILVANEVIYPFHLRRYDVNIEFGFN